MSTDHDALPETLPELRHPELPAAHPLNILDPESELPAIEQIARYREAHRRDRARRR